MCLGKGIGTERDRERGRSREVEKDTAFYMSFICMLLLRYFFQPDTVFDVMSSGADPTWSSNIRGPDSRETVTAKTNICFFPTAMFTQDYSALDELETNWWLTHLEKSHRAAWHPSHGGKKGMWSKKADPEKHLSFSMEPL